MTELEKIRYYINFLERRGYGVYRKNVPMELLLKEVQESTNV